MKENVKKHWITTIVGLLPILAFLLTFLGLGSEESKVITDNISDILSKIDGGSSITIIIASVLALASFVMNIFAKDPKEKK